MDRSSNALQKRLLQAARGIEEPLYWARHIPTPQTVKNDLSEILCSRLRTRWYLRELSEVDYCPMPKRCGCKYQVEGECSLPEALWMRRMQCWRKACTAALKKGE